MGAIIDFFSLIPSKIGLLILLLGLLSVVLVFIYKRLSPEKKIKFKFWLTSSYNVLMWLDEKLDGSDEWLEANRELLNKYLSVKDLKNVANTLDKIVHKLRIELEETGLVSKLSKTNEKNIAQKLIDVTPIDTDGVKLIKNKDGFEVKYTKRF